MSWREDLNEAQHLIHRVVEYCTQLDPLQPELDVIAAVAAELSSGLTDLEIITENREDDLRIRTREANPFRWTDREYDAQEYHDLGGEG